MFAHRLTDCCRTALAVLLGVILLGTATSVRANDTGGIRQLVQMPVAVDKLHKAGVPASNLTAMVRALNEGGVSAADVNLILYNVPLFAEDLGSLDAVSNFTVMQHERGLNGSRLSDALKRELRSRGILQTAVLPTEESFVSDRTKKIIETVKRRRLERRRRDEPPENPEETREGGGRPTAPPRPTGPGGPGGPTGPGGPGYP